jgi:hypothetical protein
MPHSSIPNRLLIIIPHFDDHGVRNRVWYVPALQNRNKKSHHWLVQSLQKCGYDIPKQKAPTSHDGPGKTKKPQYATFTLSVSEYPASARAIVNSDIPGSTVPTWVLRIVEDVISGRKFAASFWSAQKGDNATSDVRDSNECHLYFIYILEEVLEILKGGVAPEVNIPQQPNDLTQNPDGDAEEGLKNAFSALEIEEQSEEFLEWSTTQSSTVSLTAGKTNSAAIFATCGPEIDEEEIFFAVYCFFYDFNETRAWFHKAWYSTN